MSENKFYTTLTTGELRLIRHILENAYYDISDGFEKNLYTDDMLKNIMYKKIEMLDVIVEKINDLCRSDATDKIIKIQN